MEQNPMQCAGPMVGYIKNKNNNTTHAISLGGQETERTGVSISKQ
jgi:hypothetical protein